jgi:hypothetical protein
LEYDTQEEDLNGQTFAQHRKRAGSTKFKVQPVQELFFKVSPLFLLRNLRVQFIKRYDCF